MPTQSKIEEAAKKAEKDKDDFPILRKMVKFADKLFETNVKTFTADGDFLSEVIRFMIESKIPEGGFLQDSIAILEAFSDVSVRTHLDFGNV